MSDMAGFDADVQSLTALAQDMSTLSEGVRALTQQAQQAAMPDDAWGGVGQFLLPLYAQVQGKAFEGLTAGSDYWNTLGLKVKASSDAYGEVDTQIATTLTGLDAEVGR